jgi:hypothetical protein
MKAKDEVERFKRKLLADRLAMVTPKQRELFDRCYPRGVSSDGLETAIDLCNRTIEKNSRTADAEAGKV